MLPVERVQYRTFRALQRGDAVRIATTSYEKFDELLVCDEAGNKITATVVATAVVHGRCWAILAEGTVDTTTENDNE